MQGQRQARIRVLHSFYFQVRKTNLFDASDVSVWSQWLDTFLLRELLDVSRIRISRCHHGGWNLQRGIYFRYVNNGTINTFGGGREQKICDTCKRCVVPALLQMFAGGETNSRMQCSLLAFGMQIRDTRNVDIFELFILDLPRVYLVVY